jgi:hypothetical protein
MRNGRALGRLAASACCCGAACAPSPGCPDCDPTRPSVCVPSSGQIPTGLYTNFANIVPANFRTCCCGARPVRRLDIDISTLRINTEPGAPCPWQLARVFGSGNPTAAGALLLNYTRQVDPELQPVCTNASYTFNGIHGNACAPGIGVGLNAPGVWVPPPSLGGLPNTASGYFYLSCDGTQWSYHFPVNSQNTVHEWRWGHIRLQRNPGDCQPPPCQSLGACCCGGVCYPEHTQSACNGIGGSWLGAGSSCGTAQCTTTGACCFQETCIGVTEATCVALGGSWMGARPCQPRDCLGIIGPNPIGPLTPSVAGVGSVGAGAFR